MEGTRRIVGTWRGPPVSLVLPYCVVSVNTHTSVHNARWCHIYVHTREYTHTRTHTHTSSMEEAPKAEEAAPAPPKEGPPTPPKSSHEALYRAMKDGKMSPKDLVRYAKKLVLKEGKARTPQEEIKELLLAHQTLWHKHAQSVNKRFTDTPPADYECREELVFLAENYPGHPDAQLLTMIAEVENRILQTRAEVVFDAIEKIISDTTFPVASSLKVVPIEYKKENPEYDVVYTGTEPVPYGTIITAVDVVQLSIPLSRYGVEGCSWLVTKEGHSPEREHVRTHAYVIVPGESIATSRLICSPTNVSGDGKRYAHLVNDGVVELGEDGVPTFLGDLRYPLDLSSEEKIEETQKMVREAYIRYYGEAERKCNAVLTDRDGVIFVEAFPEKDPGDEAFTKKLKPPRQILPGEPIRVAYSPVWWFEKLAPEEESYTAFQSFSRFITPEFVLKVESKGIPVRRHLGGGTL